MAVYYNLILFDQRDPQIRLESSGDRMGVERGRHDADSLCTRA
jgi:hypothetical protein